MKAGVNNSTAACRCGHPLPVPTEESERVVCPNCKARVRIRRVSREQPKPAAGDGYIRFHCPCGRRLKVSESDRPSHGKCPDCGKIVPIPDTADVANANFAAPPGTVELSPDQLAVLDGWAKGVAQRVTDRADEETTTVLGTPGPSKIEAGLRTCPKCGNPVHMAATSCRECGSAVPRR